MDDKTTYWQRRHNTVEVKIADPKRPGKITKAQQPAPLRGQGDTAKPKILEKGTDDRFAAGQHMVRINRKLVMVDRKTARSSKIRTRMASKAGYKSHEVNTPAAPAIVTGTNHQRHIERRQQREKLTEGMAVAK